MSKGFQKNTKEQLTHTKGQTDLLMEGLVQNSYAIQHLQQQVDQLFGLVRMHERETAVEGSQVVLDAEVRDENGDELKEAALVTFVVDTSKPQNYPQGMVAALLGTKASDRVNFSSTMPANHPAFPGKTLDFVITVVKVLA